VDSPRSGRIGAAGGEALQGDRRAAVSTLSVAL
jgi:hypothetical protein